MRWILIALVVALAGCSQMAPEQIAAKVKRCKDSGLVAIAERRTRDTVTFYITDIHCDLPERAQ